MKFIFPFTACVLIVVLISCGGVVGNIAKYRFENTTEDALKNAVNEINSKSPQYAEFDSLRYQILTEMGDTNYYLRLRKDGYDFIFQYSYPQYLPPFDTINEIALTSAAEYGKGLKLSKDIGVFEKKKYNIFFKKYFIDELEIELRK